MMTKYALPVAAALMIGGLVIYLARSPVGSSKSDPLQTTTATATPTAATASATRSPAVISARITSVPIRPQSEHLGQYRARKDYATLLGALGSDPDRAEAAYLKAAIYFRCASRPKAADAPPAETPQARRVRFMAELEPNAPDFRKRMEAFDKLAVNPCAGVDLGSFDAATYNAMIAEAAAAGSKQAQSWLLAEQLEGKLYVPKPGERQRGYDLSAGDFNRMLGLLASGDAQVVRNLSDIISSSTPNGELRLNGDIVDLNSLHAAMTMISCDLGIPCGPDSAQMLSVCAYDGRCNANYLPDYIYQYRSTPEQAARIEQYRQQLAAMIAAGNTSGIALMPRVPSSEINISVYSGSRSGGP